MDPVALGLPHREPFLFVDAVEEVSEDGRAVARICFPKSADFFRGHFPGNPIVPGVILAEALAQTAGLAAAKLPDAPGQFLLSAIRSMKFPSGARPDETIQLRAVLAGRAGPLFQFEVCATGQDGTKFAEGQVVLNGV
jgi:3-hydroxyacyl-[acyl-carrier-protein] dehydratase